MDTFPLKFMFYFKKGHKQPDCETLQLEKACMRLGLPEVGGAWLRCALAAGGGRLLGRGAYGEVRLAKDPEGCLIVVKSFYGSVSELLAEADALWAARHVPGVQSLVGVCPESLQIVSLYAGRTTFSRALKERSLKSKEILGILKQVFVSIDGLHQQGLCHNDIKGDNVCLAHHIGGHLQATVIDFGLARLAGMVPYDFKLRRADRLYWLPPELKKKGRCCSATDVYSLASLVLQATDTMDAPPRKLLWWAQRAQTLEPNVRPSLGEGISLLEYLINPGPQNTLGGALQRDSYNIYIEVSLLRGFQHQAKCSGPESQSQVTQEISSSLSAVAHPSTLRARTHRLPHSY